MQTSEHPWQQGEGRQHRGVDDLKPEKIRESVNQGSRETGRGDQTESLQKKVHSQEAQEKMQAEKEAQALGYGEKKGQPVQGIKDHVLRVGEKGAPAQEIGIPKGKMPLQKLVP